MPVAILTDIHPIDFFGEPTCECKTEKENGGYKDTASLSFFTGSKLPVGACFGFVVTDVNDNSYLIGSLETPHPVVGCVQLTGTPSADAAGFQYDITHVAIKSMVPCII